MFTHLTGQSHGPLHSNYGGPYVSYGANRGTAARPSGGPQEVGPPPQSGRQRRCVASVQRALIHNFGAHHDHEDIARYVVYLCYRRTSVQARRILGVSTRYGRLATEIPHQHRLRFIRACLRGLRKGRCLYHQVRPRRGFRFGAEDDAEEEEEQKQQGHQFDPEILKSVLGGMFGEGGFFPTIVTSVNDQQNRDSLADAIAAAGGNPAQSQDTIDEYAVLVASLTAERDAAVSTGNQARIDALNAEIGNAQNSAIRDITSQQEGMSPWGVAGIAVGSVVLLAATVLVVTKLVSKQGSSNIYLPGYNAIY